MDVDDDDIVDALLAVAEDGGEGEGEGASAASTTTTATAADGKGQVRRKRAYRKKDSLTPEEIEERAAKRREQVARASRKTREKRRGELETLRVENERLRLERERLERDLARLEEEAALAEPAATPAASTKPNLTITVPPPPSSNATEDAKKLGLPGLTPVSTPRKNEALAELENALLRAQLKQHELFHNTVMCSFAISEAAQAAGGDGGDDSPREASSSSSSTSAAAAATTATTATALAAVPAPLPALSPAAPSREDVYREIAAQTVDMSWEKLLRLLRRSQAGEGWSRASLIADPEIAMRGVHVVTRVEQLASGTRHYRTDTHMDYTLLGALVPPRGMRDLFQETWVNPERFRQGYARVNPPRPEEDAEIRLLDLDNFSFPGAPSAAELDGVPMIGAKHWREQYRATGETVDWVFLNSSRSQTLPRSTVWAGDEAEAMLFESHVRHEAAARGLAMPSFKPPTPPSRSATVPVYGGFRTISCHLAPEDPAKQRITHNFLEAIFAWREDWHPNPFPTLPGEEPAPYIVDRMLSILVLPHDFRMSIVGSADALTSSEGSATPRFQEIVRNYVNLLASKVDEVFGGALSM